MPATFQKMGKSPSAPSMADGRQPCPDRIVEDIGGAFAIGAVGGSIWHSIKGARNAPKGSRLRGSIEAVRNRAPILGGNFAIWGCLFASFECSLIALRKKEDAWNPIASGALTGGALAARGGWRAATRSAVVGGVLLTMIEGMGFMLQRYFASQERAQQEEMLAEHRRQQALKANNSAQQAQPQTSSQASTDEASWFSQFFSTSQSTPPQSTQ